MLGQKVPLLFWERLWVREFFLQFTSQLSFSQKDVMKCNSNIFMKKCCFTFFTAKLLAKIACMARA
jgi:hypothetical protein